MIDKSFYLNKVFLITGHTGFKGTWLTKILVNLGAKVIGYSLQAPTETNLFGLSNVENEIISITGDIRDYDHLKNVFELYNPDCVIHLAAQPLVRVSYINPKYTYETNVIGTLNVLECIRITKSVKSFLNVTTDKVYHNIGKKNHPFHEDEPLNGHDPYSNSKSCSELLTDSYKKSFFQDQRCAISTARAGNVIGGGDFANDRIIPDCIRAIEKSDQVIVRNPFSIRPYQHVLEPLFLYLKIIEMQHTDANFQGYYNIGPNIDDCISTGELVSKFCSVWGNELKWINKHDGGPYEAQFLMLDNRKVKDTFGWNPVWNVDDSINRVIEWTKVYMENRNLIPKEMDRQISLYLDKVNKK